MCWSKTRMVSGCAFLVLAGAALALAGRAVAADPAELAGSLKAAREELKKAQAEERTANDARNSLSMAQAATGAIVTAQKEMIARAETRLRESEEELKQIVEEAKIVAGEIGKETDLAKKKTLLEVTATLDTEKAKVQQLLAQRITRVKSYRDQLAKDQAVGDRASASFRATEKRITDAVLATWAAVGKVQDLEAKIAGCAVAKAAADKQVTAQALAAAKTPAEKQAAEKALAAKATAEKTARDQAAAAQAALRQTQAVAAWDAQELAIVELARAEGELKTKIAAAQQLAKQAAGAKDPAKKQELSAAAAKAAAAQAACAQAVSQQRADVQAGVHRVYSLRVAALGGLKPLAPQAWDYAKARHLLNRAGFGGTPQEVQKLYEMGLYQAVDHLVNFHLQPPADVPFDAVPPAAADPLAGKLRIPGAAGRAARTTAQATAYNAQEGRLIRWWLKRLVESPRPLQEKLTLFWHGLFATQASVVKHSYATYHHNQLLREHAAGNYGALLYGIVHDPVMLRYLDNNSNVKGRANENLAREIMELFSMGASQGYDEKDVREAARALTGYTFDAQAGQFRFVGTNHDDTPKKLFGREGKWTGDDLAKLILEQPSTSRFIARRLFEFFAYHDPAKETTEPLAALLRAHNYELTPLLENIFLSEEFYGAKSMGTQVKCPLQLVVVTLRTLGVKRVADAGVLHAATSGMGQQLLEPPDVKGWRYGQPWINSARIFVRYNSTADLVRNVPQPDGRRGIDLVALLQNSGCQSSSEVVDYLIKACYLTPLSMESRAKLLDVAKDLPPVDQWAKQREAVNAKLQNLVVLMVSTPDYQVN